MATADEYAAWIIKNADQKGTPEFDVVARAYQSAKAGGSAAQVATDPISQGARNFAVDMPAWQQAAAGAGKAFADLGRGVGQMVGSVNRNDVAESRRLDAPLMNTTAGKVGNVAGNVAALAPAALIPGAGTVLGGAAIGAGMGLAQPSTSTGETLLNTGLGTAAGAVVPLAGRAWKSLKAAAEPFSEGGQNAIVGRALNKAAGSDASTVASRLANPEIFVPGSNPTVGQASGSAGVSSLERAAVATNPDVTNALDKTIKAQNAARVGVIQDMAGQGGKRDLFVADRDAVAQQLYGAARQIGIDPAKLTPDVLANVAQFAQRVPAGIQAEATKLAQISGTPLTDASSVQGMHWMKMAVDDAIDAAKRSGNNRMARALTGLQDDLVTGLGRLSPEYDAARQTYAAMSKPINQMDVAQTIADRSINPLSGNLQPNAYAKALSDKTAKSATGFQGATLENTMEPAQMDALNSVLKDVQRATTAENAGKGTGSDTVRKLAYTNLLDQAGVPSILRGPLPVIGNSLQAVGNLASRIADPLYSRANQEIGNRLAQIMLDPAQAATLMRRATPAQKSQIVNLLQQGASGAALSAPAVANSLKQ